MLAALLAPQRISRLVMIAATPCFVRRADWPHAMRPQVLEQFISGLREEPLATLGRFMALQVRAADSARATLRRLREELRCCPMPLRSGLEQGLELLRGQDLRGDLARLQCPSLWIFGERDTLVPSTVAEHIRSRVPRSQIELLPGAGHAPFLSHGSQVESLLTAFAHE
jgi:pimeloyl-[acyl-carrier protein] methyl ester esterase